MQKVVMRRERGAVLLWGVVILLTLTVIGIAASRMATVDSRIAGNQMISMQTFQGAESTLATVAMADGTGKRKRLLYYSNTPSNFEKIMDIPDLDENYCEDDASVYFCDPVSKVKADPVIQADPHDPGSDITCPVLDGISISSDMSSGCLLVTVEADAAFAGTGASSWHAEGRARLKPAVN